MVDAVSIIKKGYFPRELPPPFTTEFYGALVANKRSSFPKEYESSTKPPVISLSCVHNLTRVGSLRRKPSIPNPVNYLQLADRLTTDWKVLETHCKTSLLSLSTPDLTNTDGRAIGRKFSLNELPNQRATLRATSRYILISDISSFYPTIYTHSIPWALNGKAVAKTSKHSTVLIGNELDKFVRNGQDGQTIGIPIGPDTSLVIAEAILSAIDKEFLAAGKAKGFRYMDDYEFGFSTYAEAEQALATLQGVMNDFERQLKPSKTRILELPEPIEALWVSELRIFPFRRDARSQRYDLIRYFNRSFELMKQYPTQPVL